MDKHTERAEQNMLDRHANAIRKSAETIQDEISLILKEIETGRGHYRYKTILNCAQDMVTRGEILENLRDLSAIYAAEVEAGS